MYCPHCSVQIAQEQKFCRSCGMDLKLVAQALAEHLSPNGVKKEPNHSEADALNLLFKMLLGGVGILMAGMLVLALGRGIKIIETIGVIMLLAGGFIAFYGVISPLRPKKPVPKSSLPEAATTAEPTAKLPNAPIIEMPLDITENTTRSLEIPARETPKVLH